MFHGVYVAIVPVMKYICVLFGISLIQDVVQIISFSVLDRYLAYYFWPNGVGTLMFLVQQLLLIYN